MNSKERERIATLRKRMAHLEDRIARDPQKDLSYDKQELSALKWATDFIEGAIGEKGAA